jgi:hypothetical protein
METSNGVRAGRAAVACAIALALAGCAPRVTVTRTRPAELELAGLDRVAVLEIRGNDGPPSRTS